ncbi:hypothetical protein ACFLYX_02155, partial [Chloroflexota bacterium]
MKSNKPSIDWKRWFWIILGLTSLLLLLFFLVKGTTHDTCCIEVKAALDDQPWTGTINYAIQGPTTKSASSAPQGFTGLPIGTYTITHDSGGPPNAVLSDISPSDTEEVSAESTTTFTLNFESQTSAIEVKATLDGHPWTGTVNYTIQGPTTKSGFSATQSFTGLPFGTYTITHDSGGPPNAVLSDISPSDTEELYSGTNTIFILNFKSPGGTTPDFVPTGDIIVEATYKNKPWEGSVRYTIEGPVTESGTSVPQRYSGLPVGTYRITHNSGRPVNSRFVRILPSSTEELSAGDNITFTLLFKELPGYVPPV